MGIDAQRSGTSELRDRAVEVRRAQGARRKAMSVHIVDDEQLKRSPQDPCALRVPAEPGPRYRASGAAAARPRAHLARPPLPPQAAVGGPGRRCRPSTMYTDIACGPAPSMWHLVKPLLVPVPYRLGFRSPGFPLSGPPLWPGDGVKASRSEPAGLGLDAALPGHDRMAARGKPVRAPLL